MLIKELLKNNYKKDIDEKANANAHAQATKAKKASQQAFINTLLAERQVLNNKKN